VIAHHYNITRVAKALGLDTAGRQLLDEALAFAEHPAMSDIYKTAIQLADKMQKYDEFAQPVCVEMIISTFL